MGKPKTIEEATRQFENTISFILDSELQECMFSISSQYKYTLAFIENIGNGSIYLTPSWEDRVRNCMYKKLEAIFVNGNWVDKFGYIIAIPGSYWWQLSSCTWDATFNKHLHHTHY